MKDYKLVINTRNKKYPIYIGYNILKTSNKIFRNNKINIKKCLIVGTIISDNSFSKNTDL